ncbi:HlyD family efflux transporter periplasmic adaptor subunit [Methylobacterium oryzihabitans]|uniref:HlyD family efflux transporter periplasmic adaptor subunit n=1 Tax=Methylobacterium oryzihabitans TaxID=2499852 RepID=A0A437P9Y9_9HYPH|nr:HlyD family efflux transporter periplasmic adaptor subunit [Methylobacterium oryzihabitans]RVU19087.1 HlyD family efflux transporter periplasmic adaptor subunit [Methylobacterium oryzihabitans]
MSEPFLSPSWHRVGPLRPRLRPNLTIRRQRVQGGAWYVVHDPLTGKAHRCGPAAYSVLGAMDGRRTVDEIWREAAERLGADAPSQTVIVQLLSQLHAADLLQANVASDAAELLRRHAAQRRRDRIGRFLNPMSLRVALLDPDRFLAATAFLVRPMVSWAGLLAWLVCVVAAGLVLAPHWHELTGNLADRVLTPQGLALVAVVFPLLKALHELGHGYAVKVGGGEVHETGLVFVALFPVPYVEASASAAFRSKWRRAGVAAAGMLVETFVAALAAFVWVTVEPGLVRAVAFNVMLIAGVSTLVFNANPLMRLDGYFILSDLVEVPNLAQRANRFYGWLVERRLFGAEVERPQGSGAETAWFLAYAPAAFAYRMAVLVGLSLFLADQWFVLGVAMALLGVAMGVGLPLAKMLWHVVSAPRLARVRGRAVGVTLGSAAAAGAFLALAPMPLWTTTEGVIWLPEDATVRMGVNGIVRRVVALPGAAVRPGDLLIEGTDPTLVAEAEVLRAQIESLDARLVAEQFSDRVQADVTRQDIAAKREALARAEAKLDALNVRAATAGILEIPRVEHLEGRWVRRGDMLGYVVRPEAAQVRVVVPQADIDLIRRAVHARILLPDDLWRPIDATLVREVPAASDRLPSRALAADSGGRMATDSRDPKAPRSLDRWFQLDLALPPGAVTSHYGGRVHVRFDLGSEPLGDQWWRRGRQLFLSRLAT